MYPVWKTCSTVHVSCHHNSLNDMGGETDRFLIAWNLLMTLSLQPKICTPVGKNKPQYFMTSPPNQHFLSWNSSLSSSIISAHQLFNVLTDAKRLLCNIHTIRSNHKKNSSQSNFAAPSCINHIISLQHLYSLLRGKQRLFLFSAMCLRLRVT